MFTSQWFTYKVVSGYSLGVGQTLLNQHIISAIL